MIPEDFRAQIFKTPEQWGSGLFYRLDAQEKGGITLYPTLAFAEWIIQVKNSIKNPAALAVDECGQIYLFDSDTTSKICRLYRYDCETQNLEHLTDITYYDSSQECIQCPQRMILSKNSLWVNDSINKRVLAFSMDDYQIKNVIDRMNGEIIEPVDIGLDECENLYVLIKKSNENQIIKFDKYGNWINTYELNLSGAIGLASGKKNVLYVIDSTNKQLLKYTEKCTENDSNLVLISTVDLSKEKISNLQLSGIVVAGNENIFLNDRDKDKGFIHQFDSDGNSLGIVKGFTEIVQGFAVDFKGDLYVSSSKGICKFGAQNTFTREAGTYYSKALDSGIQGCQWHRMVLEMDLPPRTLVELSYSSSDEEHLQRDIDRKITAENVSKQEKANFIDDKLKWSEPAKFSSSYSNLKEKQTSLQEKQTNQQGNLGEFTKTRKYMLFQGKQGRYLWLKVKLSTFDDKVKPTVTQMKILYPRISYLRYLPAIYQENPASKDFVERFLSIFETAAYDLETKISHIYKYFDPATVPLNFLNWLASWLNIALEEDWQEEKKRQLIQKAYSLYKQKGTPSGISNFIEFYTGKKPVLLEHSKIEKPMVLREKKDLKSDRDIRLGINSFLLETPFTGLKLGDEAILGKVVLQDSIQSPADPFLRMAHRFTILLDLSGEEKTRFEKQLRRILDDEKPAHTVYNLRFSSSTKELESRVEINTKLDYYINTKPDHYNLLRLGADVTIGSAVVVANGERGSRMGRNSVVGVDTELIS